MAVIRQRDVTTETADIAHLARGVGPYTARLYSDDGGLTQFGAFVETLPPGSRSGSAHWHENEDEFVYVLSGALEVCEGERKTTLHRGDAATFRAGDRVGHYLANTSDDDVSYLVVGTRAARDVAHMTDADAVMHREGASKVWTDRAGRPITR